MSNHNKAFGCVLRKFRKQKLMTQEALAFESGLDRTYISLLERGERSPTLDTIMAVCTALQITLSCISADIDVELSTHG